MNIYIKLVCEAMTDPKVLAAGPEGFTLWVKGLLYSKQHATEGFVPRSALPLVAIGVSEPETVATRLVEVGLWCLADDGWTVGEEKWGRHQVSNSEIARKREEWRKRKERQRKNPTVTHGTKEVVPQVSRESHTNVTPPDNRQQTTDLTSLREVTPFPPLDGHADVTGGVTRDKPVTPVALEVVDDAAELVLHLVRLTGTRFDPKAQRRFVEPRLKDGATPADVRLVFDFKHAQWHKSDKMRQYLRPETLCRPSHWDGYMAAAVEWDANGRPEFDANGKEAASVLDKTERRLRKTFGDDWQGKVANA